jgi:hypothetical protein
MNKVSELSSLLTTWPVLRCSPFRILDERGREYQLVTWSAEVPSATEPDGRKVPTGAPTLRQVIREVPATPAGEAK